MAASRPLPPPPPERSDRLLAAVAERDGGLANRLLQQWVHRRGLSSLEAWILGPLLSSQGSGAVAWLRHLLEDSGPEPIAAIEKAGIEKAAIDQVLPDSPGSDAPVTDFRGPQSPAPAPVSLAALRAWLPDRSNDDSPLAC